jgi:hypothetical protein
VARAGQRRVAHLLDAGCRAGRQTRRGLSGAGNAISLSSVGVTEGGLFWIFGAGNPEKLIKIINGPPRRVMAS